VHFTVHLRGENTTQDDFSYGLVFIPCPVWMKGSKQLLNLNPDRPDLRPGSVARLIEQEGIKEKLVGSKQAIVLIHPQGHGSMADVTTLLRDLLEQEFCTKVYGEIDNTGPSETKK
jgi:hypothetical protein